MFGEAFGMEYVYIFQALLGVIALFLASVMGWNYFLRRSSFYQKLQEHKKIKLLDKSSFGRAQVYYLGIEHDKFVLTVSAKGEVAMVRMSSSAVNRSQDFLDAIMGADILGHLNDVGHERFTKKDQREQASHTVDEDESNAPNEMVA